MTAKNWAVARVVDGPTFEAGSSRWRLVLGASVWTLFCILALRFLAIWINALAGTSMPVPVSGRIGFTLIFMSFSLMHASSQLGWRRAVAFLMVCAFTSWAFEAVGIATGVIYGAYHYGDQLGPKLGAVPLIIPLAWFMMIYASWVVAGLLMEGAGDSTAWPAKIARILIASFAMTAWDTVMDPGMARTGVWTWELGGEYFGVPLQNFAGWLVTTLTVYGVTEIVFRYLPKGDPAPNSRVYFGLPALAYGFIAFDRLLLPDLPELRIVAAFGMMFIALLSGLRLILPRAKA